MFEYSDPSGQSFNADSTVTAVYRREMDLVYRAGGRFRQSAFTILDAFEIVDPQHLQVAAVEWPAFPVLLGQSDNAIDNNRFLLQDEYVEWRVDRSANGDMSIIFTTEFPEYFEAFAGIGFDALRAAIKAVNAKAEPTPDELFGPGPAHDAISESQRIDRFRNFRQSNPWNNGEKDILCLTQGANTLGALINLLVRCSVPRTDLDPTQVCAAVGGFCGDGRNSDPRISVAVQNLARGDLVFSAADPIGISIERLDGSWTLDGQPADMTSVTANGENLWTIERNGRRGVLRIPAGTDLRLNGAPVSSGAQISRVLIVASRVVATNSTRVPDWARTGNEHLLPPS